MGASCDCCCECCREDLSDQSIMHTTTWSRARKSSTEHQLQESATVYSDVESVHSEIIEPQSISTDTPHGDISLNHDAIPLPDDLQKGVSFAAVPVQRIGFTDDSVDEHEDREFSKLSTFRGQLGRWNTRDLGLELPRLDSTASAITAFSVSRSLSFVPPSSLKNVEAMVDDEQIDILINMKLPDSVKTTLGDPATYILPTEQPERGHIERDMRKIKVSLLECKLEEAEQRKYAKLCILKYYDLLTSIYKRYCKIGRDTQWMTMFGWISLLRDCGMVKTENDEQQFMDIFHRVYQYHHENLHAAPTPMYGNDNLQDADPWTGIWMLQKLRKQNMKKKQNKDNRMPRRMTMPPPNQWAIIQSEHYKFRKIGDRKLVGCQLNSKRGVSRLIIAGWLNRGNFKKANLRARTEKKKKDKREFQCQLIAPETEDDPLEMRIKWEHKKKGSASTQSGKVKLFKYRALDEFDVDLPAMNYVGLSRHEFFDAFLCVARLSDEKSPLYLLSHELVESRLDSYIYRNMVNLRTYLKGKEIEDELHDQLHTDAAVVRLFKKYAILQKETEHIEEDAWCALAEDLYSTAKSMDQDIWKNGGKLSWEMLVACFTLSKPADVMDEEWINLGEFIRCLIYFTDALFRDQPNAKYKVLPFEDKMDMVLNWCQKMDAQSDGTGGDLPQWFNSKSLDMVKKRKSTLSPSPPPLNNILSYDSSINSD